MDGYGAYGANGSHHRPTMKLQKALLTFLQGVADAINHSDTKSRLSTRFSSNGAQRHIPRQAEQPASGCNGTDCNPT